MVTIGISDILGNASDCLPPPLPKSRSRSRGYIVSMSTVFLTLSVHQVVRRELALHKWLESEKAGMDLGEEAIRDWVQRFWDKFLRGCWTQHILGEVHWVELGAENFGICKYEFEEDPLAEEILRLFLQGGNVGENLGIIMRAQDLGWPMEEVFDILHTIDINSYRLVRQVQECVIREYALARQH